MHTSAARNWVKSQKTQSLSVMSGIVTEVSCAPTVKERCAAASLGLLQRSAAASFAAVDSFPSAESSCRLPFSNAFVDAVRSPRLFALTAAVNEEEAETNCPKVASDMRL